MPIVQVISIIGKPNLWNRAQQEFMLWRWKLNFRKSVNPILSEGRIQCIAFGERICNTVWCLVLFLNERLYACVPLKVHLPAFPSVSFLVCFSYDDFWAVSHYSPFCGAFVYVCLCVCDSILISRGLDALLLRSVTGTLTASSTWY